MLDPPTHRIRSSDGTRTYVVTLGDPPTCTCPDFTYRGTHRDGSPNGHRCKHILGSRPAANTPRRRRW